MNDARQHDALSASPDDHGPGPMKVDDLATLLWPGDADPSPSAQELGRIKDRVDLGLRTQIAAHARREWWIARVRGLLAPTTVGACVLAVGAALAIAVSMDRPAPVTSDPVVAQPAAVDLLELASSAVKSSEPLAGGDDQYVYVRTMTFELASALGDEPVLGPLHEREVWLSQDSDKVSDQGVIREYGQDWPIWHPGGAAPSADRPTYRWLEEFADDPEELVRELREDADFTTGGRDTDHALFNNIAGLLTDSVVPPSVATELFDALTRIDGVTRVAHVTDALNRRGVGVTHESTSWIGRSVLVFDPTTYQVLGARYYHTGPGPDALVGGVAVLEQGFSDASGRRPDQLMSRTVVEGRR
jgi:hypothetical protein